MEIQFETVKYHDFNAGTSHLTREMLHEIHLSNETSLRTFHVVKGARETGMRAHQPAKPQRPQDSTSKIIQIPPRLFTIHQLNELLILI